MSLVETLEDRARLSNSWFVAEQDWQFGWKLYGKAKTRSIKIPLSIRQNKPLPSLTFFS
jgi:hypothetical protein